MPIMDAAKKAVRHSASRKAINTRIKRKTRVAVKEARVAIQSGDKKAPEAVNAAVKELDRAASKGTFKKNTVSRTKSRLHAALGKMGNDKTEKKAVKAKAPAVTKKAEAKA